MKWLILIVGGIVLLVGLVAAIGAMLPRDHHATRTARYHVAPDALFAVLMGPPDWRTGVKSFGGGRRDVPDVAIVGVHGDVGDAPGSERPGDVAHLDFVKEFRGETQRGGMVVYFHHV